MNPNQSETKFSIQINPNQSELGLIQTEFLIRINPNHSELGLIRIKNLVSDWCGSIFYRFSSNELQNFFRISSEKFALARVQISEWIGVVLIGSEWISIRYFHQGNFQNAYPIVFLSHFSDLIVYFTLLFAIFSI